MVPRLLAAWIAAALVAGVVALARHADPLPGPAVAARTGPVLVGRGFAPDEPGVVRAGDEEVGRFTTGEDGTFEVAVPAAPEATGPLVVEVGGEPEEVPTEPPPAGDRPFAATSPWNAPIPDDASVDARSPAIVAWLAGHDEPGVANLYEFGVPIWEPGDDAVPQEVPCTMPWGTCGLAGKLVPMPADAAPAAGSDGAMVVVDRRAGVSYELWQARRTGSSWTTSWGGALPLDGDGVGTAANSATGAAVSRLAGVVRAEEIAAGRIDHALVFSSQNACEGDFRHPAAETDGESRRDDCIPQGARIQLDPSVDLDAIEGMGPGERAVAEALQRYGAYAMDKGGAPMAFVFEVPSGEPDPYPAAGLEWDYFAFDRIPWDRLWVLASWDGR